MAGRVEGKLALVTGGAQGLGAAIAMRLAQEGARVLVTDMNGAGAEESAEAINAETAAGTAFAMQHDVTQEDQWIAVMNSAREKLGGLSVLVNNAGIGVRGDIESCTLEDWRHGFAVNSDGPFLGCKHGMALLKDSQPASIINISSIAGLIASHTMPGYNASKAAVWMLSKSVALYGAKKGWDIRCNSVHPTFIDTPILDGIGKNAGIDKSVVMDKLARQIPLGRVGQPADIASAVLYLASDESRFVTGAEIKVDGGISAM
ncbi:glucose 1-dehydrogenase [Altererythrobacter sp. SALINAS58]|uniref:SDR family oxidoreductase n=1 Tax=Alteripontixanthobacter muriae TaxID=2705546 RepID=UPI0015766434|nr:SDR family oxidoreductase [Alteripontixanthobacter muriae]NTZ42828.1 glucose 1-dehydrogenase [Alteripontixanthobacter muriae]